MESFSQQVQGYLEHLNEKIAPEDKGTLDRIAINGQKIMFSKSTHKYMLAMLDKEGEMADKLGYGIVELLGMLFMQSKGALPGRLLIPAGAILLAKACEFVDRTEGGMSMDIFADALELVDAGIKKQATDAEGKQGQQGNPGQPPAQPSAPQGLIGQGA